MKRAIVLSGGGHKGAFSAGAVDKILVQGYEPDIIRGISVGALNSAYLTYALEYYDYPEIAGEMLTEFWAKHIHSYKDFIEKQYIKGIFGMMFNKFNGFTNTKPLQKLLNKHVDFNLIKQSKIDTAVGATNINTGEIEYVHNTNDNFKKFTLASSAIPLVMPMVSIYGDAYYDGGIRDIAPLKSAIEAGADEIVIILNSPLKVPVKAVKTNKVLDLANRLLSVLLNEVLANDIAKLQRINVEVKNGRKDKKFIRYKLIQPSQPIEPGLMDFDNADIINMLNQGAVDAARANWNF